MSRATNSNDAASSAAASSNAPRHGLRRGFAVRRSNTGNHITNKAFTNAIANGMTPAMAEEAAMNASRNNAIQYSKNHPSNNTQRGLLQFNAPRQPAAAAAAMSNHPPIMQLNLSDPNLFFYRHDAAANGAANAANAAAYAPPPYIPEVARAYGQNDDPLSIARAAEYNTVYRNTRNKNAANAAANRVLKLHRNRMPPPVHTGSILGLPTVAAAAGPPALVLGRHNGQSNARTEQRRALGSEAYYDALNAPGGNAVAAAAAQQAALNKFNTNNPSGGKKTTRRKSRRTRRTRRHHRKH